MGERGSVTPIVVFTFGELSTLVGIVASLLLGRRTRRSSLFMFMSNTQRKGIKRQRLIYSMYECVRGVINFGDIGCAFSRAGGKLNGSIVGNMARIVGQCNGTVILRSSLVLTPGFLFFVGRNLSGCGRRADIFSVYKCSGGIGIPGSCSCSACFYAHDDS